MASELRKTPGPGRTPRTFNPRVIALSLGLFGFLLSQVLLFGLPALGQVLLRARAVQAKGWSLDWLSGGGCFGEPACYRYVFAPLDKTVFGPLVGMLSYSDLVSAVFLLLALALVGPLLLMVNRKAQEALSGDALPAILLVGVSGALAGGVASLLPKDPSFLRLLTLAVPLALISRVPGGRALVPYQASFATPEKVEDLLLKKRSARWREDIGRSIFLGEKPEWRALVVSRPGAQGRKELEHVLIVAPTRAGKGLHLQTLTRHWRGTLAIVDIKGEMCRRTARFRKEVLGQRILVLDPKNPVHRYDPFADLRTEEEMRSAVRLILNTGDPENKIFEDRATYAFLALLYFSKALEEHTASLSEKRARVLLESMLYGEGERSVFPPGTEGLVGKALVRLLSTLPKDELYSLAVEALLEERPGGGYAFHPSFPTSLLSVLAEEVAVLLDVPPPLGEGSFGEGEGQARVEEWLLDELFGGKYGEEEWEEFLKVFAFLFGKLPPEVVGHAVRAWAQRRPPEEALGYLLAHWRRTGVPLWMTPMAFVATVLPFGSLAFKGVLLGEKEEAPQKPWAPPKKSSPPSFPEIAILKRLALWAFHKEPLSASPPGGSRGEDPSAPGYRSYREARRNMASFYGSGDDEKFRESSWSILTSSLQAFTSKGVMAMLSGSDFTAGEMVKGPCTLYLRFPESELEATLPVLKLLELGLFAGALRTIDKELGGYSPNPILWAFDDAGRAPVPELPNHVSTWAGRNMYALTYVQDLSQLEKAYEESGAQTILANTLQVFYTGNPNAKTAEYVAGRLGKYTVESASYTYGQEFSESRSFVSRELIAADEFSSRSYTGASDEDVVIFPRGRPPILAKRVVPWGIAKAEGSSEDSEPIPPYAL